MMRRLLTVSFSLACFLGTTLIMPAQAAMITTQESLGTAARASDLATVQAWMARDQVQAEMQKFGVAPELAAERAAALSDSELHELAGKVGSDPAGGGLLGVIGIVFVVLLILELVGVINVFNRV